MAAAVGRPDAHAGEVPVAYVEVAEDSGLSRDDILAWAREHIGERAAVPKDVFVVDEIPLTAVGKIFKPKLRWDATRRIYEQELKALGDMAQSVEISVNEDKVHGTKAAIRIKAAKGADPEEIKKKVPEILARYTIQYEVLVEEEV